MKVPQCGGTKRLEFTFAYKCNFIFYDLVLVVQANLLSMALEMLPSIWIEPTLHCPFTLNGTKGITLKP